MSATVRLAIEGAVAHVTLSHPGKLNAISRAMWIELRGIFERVQATGAADEQCQRLGETNERRACDFADLRRVA